MCTLLKYVYTNCNHPDRDGRASNSRAAGYDRSGLAHIRYCGHALSESRHNPKGKTALCFGQKTEDMDMQVEYMEGKCWSCANAQKREEMERMKVWRTGVLIGKDLV
jgi:hypothetical protein